jgi:hypothetical protein
MYCLVRAIWRNSLVTAEVAASSTFDSRLISVESTSISSSERLLKILADTSAPRLASRIAPFVPLDGLDLSRHRVPLPPVPASAS